LVHENEEHGLHGGRESKGDETGEMQKGPMCVGTGNYL